MLSSLLLASVVLTGTVRDGVRGQPVPGARVWIEGETLSAQLKPLAPFNHVIVADEAGNYRVELPEAPIQVGIWAEAVGHTTREVDKHARHVLPEGTKEWKFDMVLPRASRIRGVLVDAQTMQPLSGVPVELHESRWWHGKRALQPVYLDIASKSNASGLFELSSVPPGEYALLLGPSPGVHSTGSASAAGQGYRRIFYPDGAGDGKTVTVQAGSEVDLGRIELRRQNLYTVSGRVGADCANSVRMSVRLEPLGTISSQGSGRAMVECGGTFSFSNVAPGPYRLIAEGHGFGRMASVDLLDLGEKDATVTLVPQPPISITGQVLWPSHIEKSPVEFLWILQPRVVDEGPTHLVEKYPGKLSPDGKFTISLMGNRQYYYQSYDRPPAPGFYIKEVLYNGVDAHLGLRPDPHASEQNLKIVLSDKPARVEGTARKGQVLNVPATVVLVPWPAEMVNGFPVNMTAYTDRDGKFVMKDLRPGAYRAFAVSGASSRLDEPGVLMNLAQGARDIVLQEGQTLALILDRVDP